MQDIKYRSNTVIRNNLDIYVGDKWSESFEHSGKLLLITDTTRCFYNLLGDVQPFIVVLVLTTDNTIIELPTFAIKYVNVDE
jgi:hypothetical protein